MKLQKWFVWYTEYPEEGAEVFEAMNHQDAKKKMRSTWGYGEDRDTELSASLATPEQIEAWEKSGD